MSTQLLTVIAVLSFLAMIVSQDRRNWNMFAVSLVVCFAAAFALGYRLMGGT